MKSTNQLHLTLWGLGIFASIASSQNPGTFIAIGNMTEARADHTATLLYNGKVLIAGGDLYVPPLVLASAELYDPSTGAFTPTGNMTTARAGHSATLLPNGRVLICGGTADLSAEIYDPATGTFTAAGAMVVLPYSWQAATLLQDGRVFIASQPTAQLYDPVPGTFAVSGSYAAPAPTYIEPNGVTLLADGRVLLTGGNVVGEIAGWTELYDPGTDNFSVTGTSGDSANWWYNVNTATLLMNGKVLIAGSDEYDEPADAELYDPATGAVTAIGNTAAGHEYAAATLLPDGSVLITGGQLAGGNGKVVSELYTPATGSFSAAGNMVTGRHEHTATLLPDGTVLIAGGYSIWPSSTSSAEIYSPPVLQAAPVLFSLWHAATGQAASPGMPAVAGEALAMYTTSLVDGSVIPPQVSIGGRFAEILFFGDAPGYPGFNQVNIRVPDGVAPGSAVPVRLTYLGRSSNEVTIAVQ
ncbi:MAG: kelch repeat-containing protein [Bryobacteraceae bacterium]|jgi:uncharacterized protein (TIGR03437 family)